MEIKEMNIEELEQRSLEIAENAKEADKETLESLGAELEEIETRKAELRKEAEERAKAMEEVINAPAPSPVVEERNTKMTNIEVRKTNEYIEAYERFVKGGYKDDTECRALLTENVSGSVPVPAYLEDRINTAWENDGIMSRVNRISLPGNVKVGYEASASDAVLHTEGTTAVSEESLSLGIITLVPKMIKKWISVSDEALALTGTAFLDYLYDELEYRIIKKAADVVIAKIAASSLVENAGSAAPIDAVLTAFSELSDEATDIVAVMSKTTYATIKSAAKAANYAVDPFEGFPVVFKEGVTGVIVGDLKGVTANFPEGGDPKFIFDDYTLMTQDLVRILGRLYVAIDVTAPGRLAKVTLSSPTTATT